MHIEPGLYASIVDIIVAMNNKFRERLGAQAFEYNRIIRITTFSEYII